MQTLEVTDYKRDLIRKKSFKPQLEDALQVLKSPLHNPEAKDFKKIMHVMKNCYFFRKAFPSQIALNEFVEIAKSYVEYEVHKYGSVLVHDKEYADKIYIILDGTVDKILQKPFREIEGQVQDKWRRVSCLGLENPSSFLHLEGQRKESEGQKRTLKVPLGVERNQRSETGKTCLPSSHDNTRFLKTSESCDSEGNSSHASNPRNSASFIKRSSLPKPRLINQIKTVQRHHSQQSVFQKLENPNPKPVATEPSSTFEDLVRSITSKDPEIRRKYYAEDILRADSIKTFTTGEYFGETFCISNHPRSNFMYAVSSPEAHLLTLKSEDYHEIMKQLEQKNHEKLQAFWNLFPSFDKELVQRFSLHFSQKHFEVDQVIYSQGSSVKDLYILQSGGVQLLRNQESSNENHHKKDLKEGLLPIASVIKDQVFGEESLLMMNSRQETAVANGFNTTVFALSASSLQELRDEFASLFDDLQNSAQEKFHWRQRKAKELVRVGEPSPTESSPKYHFASLRKLPLLPIRDVGEVQNLYKPRHTIQVPSHRSFFSEKSPINSPASALGRLLDSHSLSVRSTAGSPTSSNSTFKLRKLSGDDELYQSNSKANEIYKSQFGRTSIISESLRTMVHNKRNTLTFSQVCDFSPGSDLKTLNFRKDLYAAPAGSKTLGRFGAAVANHSGQEIRQNPNVISRKQVKNCDSSVASPHHKESQSERKSKPRTSVQCKDYLPTCKMLAGLNKINVHWN